MGGITGPFTTEMAGTVNLEINGGKITGVIKAILDNTSKVTGNVNVTCTAEFASKIQGNFTTKTVK